MLEVLQRTSGLTRASATPASSAAARGLVAGWRDGLAIVNLRGDGGDVAFRDAVAVALGTPLPRQACSTVDSGGVRLVWAGPDDWFVVGPKGQAGALVDRLRQALAGQHHAVTDVSSGYTVLQLSGAPLREVLAQGCPLDLHPRAFKPGSAAGTLFFKASVWLWQTDEAAVWELLVRRSFTGYVWTMLERCTAECGLVTRRFA